PDLGDPLPLVSCDLARHAAPRRRSGVLDTSRMPDAVVSRLAFRASPSLPSSPAPKIPISESDGRLRLFSLSPRRHDRLDKPTLFWHPPANVAEASLFKDRRQLGAPDRVVGRREVGGLPLLPRLAHDEQVCDVGTAVVLPIPDLEDDPASFGTDDDAR